MDIIITQEQGRVPITVFRLHGSLDASNYQELEAEFRRAQEAGARHILLDLTDVPYVSSAGIRAINMMFQGLRRSAGETGDTALFHGLRDGTYKSPHLKLLSPNPMVRNVLSMTGMDMLLDIYADVDDAVAAF
jgi:anti-anti-sigma factor